MTNKYKYFSAIVILLSIISLSSVRAEEGLSIVPIKVELDSNIDASTTSTSTSTDVKYKSEVNANSSASSSTNAQMETKSTTTSETSKSTVATFVQALLKVADRERGIGAQVKVVAQDQQSSSEKTVEATEKIETRSKIKTFFFGSDYKNLGVVRSEMVKTENQITKLEALAKKAVTASAKAELNAQIEVLKSEQIKIQAFLDAHTSTFSLFGWLKKKD